MFNQIDLFAGIGGFSVAGKALGFETVATCEYDSFNQTLLAHHYKGAEQYGDIYAANFIRFRGHCDLVTGGFPCQPFSIAGQRKGEGDDRYLWPEMLRAIQEIQPRWVVGENVPGLLTQGGGLAFTRTRADLEALGYGVETVIIPACAVGAPHRRDRIWIIAANPNRPRCQKQNVPAIPDTPNIFDRAHNAQLPDWRGFPSQPPVLRGNDGLSERVFGIAVDTHQIASIRAMGNAIVPQVAYEIFRAIIKTELELA